MGEVYRARGRFPRNPRFLHGHVLRHVAGRLVERTRSRVGSIGRRANRAVCRLQPRKARGDWWTFSSWVRGH
jgi:hypothetical protein